MVKVLEKGFHIGSQRVMILRIFLRLGTLQKSMTDEDIKAYFISQTHL